MSTAEPPNYDTLSDPDLPEGALPVEEARSVSGPRSEMVRKVCDIVVLPATRISANERSFAADILLQVLDKVEPELRSEVALRVSRVTEAPSALVRMILLDDPEIAEQVIRKAESVAEPLLIECVQKGTTAHRLAVARRIDLTPNVADALIHFNELEVAKLLLRREEFILSPTAIDILVARSVFDVEIQQLLLKRREIEPAHGFMMFWWVEKERRKRILTRFAIDRSIIQDTLQNLYPPVFRSESPDGLVKEILVMLDRRHRPRGVNGEPVSMDIVIRTLAASVKHPAQEIIHAISLIAGVSRELAGRILRDQGGEPFAVMCKSLGVPRDQYFRIITQPGPGGADSDQEAEELMEIFDSMSRDFSRAVLRYWDWDGNPRIASITRLLGLEDELD